MSCRDHLRVRDPRSAWLRRTVWPVTVLLLGLALFGCGEDAPAPSSGPIAESRGVAIAAKPKGPDLASFCEMRHGKGAGPSFSFPELAGETPKPTGGWRWVNIWATWCKPCVEELPLLGHWGERLKGEGHSVEMLFVSADRDDETIAQFREQHPGAPTSHRVVEIDALPDWLSSVGMDQGAPLPIHFLVAPDGKIRCGRAGSVKDDDYKNVLALLEE